MIKMATYSGDAERIEASAQRILDFATDLRGVQTSVGSIKLADVIDGRYSNPLERSIGHITESILDEAARASSFGNALQIIANAYRSVEGDASGALDSISANDPSTESSEQSGTDKRSWWNKLWDWVTRKEPDDYDTTDSEQEKAANAAMKSDLWRTLQDEKYSQKHWDNAGIEERKQILQDYMNKVITAYGLKDVKSSINWDPNAKYSSRSITWGYYSHGNHTVTLNERVLTDSVGSWDSYELLETVSHELRHAYQHEAIDYPTDYMVSQETITRWKKNFDNYINSDKDYEGYRRQPVEVDARDFQVRRNGHY